MVDLDRSSTSRLFARPSFFEGIARLLDFTNSLQVYNYSKTEAEADAKALAGDWRMVGRDIKAAVDEYDQEEAPKE
ncbi:MAG: hypothetical protein U9N55_02725 [candidate division Zixibacteria bacterium]|nr:hypothetical protein [candidate division Zixibacteria bacterium]